MKMVCVKSMYARLLVEPVCKGMMALTGVICCRRWKSLLILRIVSSLEILWLQRMSIYSSGDREIVNSIPKSKFPMLCLPISYMDQTMQVNHELISYRSLQAPRTSRENQYACLCNSQMCFQPIVRAWPVAL